MNRRELNELIRRLAKQEVAESIDNHLEEFVHKEKPLENFEKE